MKQSTRIILNSCVGYAKIVIAIALGFLTTRLLVQAIGWVDYGILTALGASGIVSTIIVSGLGSAARRHLAFEVGKGDRERLREVFCSTLAVFAALGATLLVLGALLYPAVFAFLNTPPEREGSAKIVYWTIVVQWAVSTQVAPCKALMHAHQHIVAHSVFELIGKVSNLVIVLALAFMEGDALVLWVLLAFGARVMEALGVMAYIFFKYPAARLRLAGVNRRDTKRVMSFAGWSLLSTLTLQLRQQGVVYVVNVFFGPIANAACALGTAINNYVHLASQGVQNALQPAMTAVHAKQKRKQFDQLISAGSRYTWYASLFFFIPIMLEAPYFLKLWLGDYPPGAPGFARLATVAGVLGYAVNGHALAMASQDRMRELVRVSTGLQVASFVLGVIAIPVFDLPAWGLFAFIIGGSVSMWIAIPLWFGESLGFPIGRWFREVLIPGLVVTAIGFGAGVAVQLSLEVGFWRLCAVTAGAGLGLVGAIAAVGSTSAERDEFRRIFRRAVNRSRLRLASK